MAIFCRSFSHMERTAGTLRHHHIRRPSDGREDGSAHLLRASKVSRSSNDQNHWYEQHDQPARNDYLPEETQETQHENRYTVALRSDFAVPPVSGHLMPLNTVLTCLLAAGVQGRCAARASSLHWCTLRCRRTPRGSRTAGPRRRSRSQSRS